MDGKADYTYALRSFFPPYNVNNGQLVKIRNNMEGLPGRRGASSMVIQKRTPCAQTAWRTFT